MLGCTHYPLLERVIGETVGPGVTLVDSARATARVVRARLEERGLLATGAGGGDQFIVTDSPERFREVGSRFLGGPIARLEQIDIQG